jgi:hypothetical protein
VTSLRIKTVLYLSIIASGWLLGFVFPFAQLFGVCPAILFIAIFKPYFGWKKTIAISLAVSMLVATVSFGSAISLSQTLRSLWSGYDKGLLQQLIQSANLTKDDISKIQIFTSVVEALPYEVIMIGGIFLVRTLVIMLYIFALRKTAIWRIIQL